MQPTVTSVLNVLKEKNCLCFYAVKILNTFSTLVSFIFQKNVEVEMRFLRCTVQIDSLPVFQGRFIGLSIMELRGGLPH